MSSPTSPLDRAIAELRANFEAPPGGLDRCEEILSLQYLALARDRPLARLPDSVRLAAAVRMRAGEQVMPRERVPIETRRVVDLVVALARTILDDPGPLDASAGEWVEALLPAAVADDATGVHDAALRMGLPPEVAMALLREALKPEMLRTSSAFRELAQGGGPRSRCPLCHERPCAATESGEACCRWCGLIWPWDSKACPACSGISWKSHAIGAIARHARILRCATCGEVVDVFRTIADPLVLSMHVVLAAPFDLALRSNGGRGDEGEADASSSRWARRAFPVF